MNIFQDRKDQLIKIFQDTESYFSQFEKEINFSTENSKIYKEVSLETESKYSEPAKVIVNKYKTIESAQFYKKKNPDCKIGILNFASATNPGGGVRKGSSAQEECICRVSTLYPVLANSDENKKNFYNYHRNLKSNLYSDRIIYSPNILVFKSDSELPSILPKKNWIFIDVLTCAAPNLNRKPNQEMNPEIMRFKKLSETELYNIHYQRGKQILSVASKNNIDILILGAFGCGAFRNSPYIVAEAYRKLISDLFSYSFRELAFSVFYSNESSKENYKVFKEILG